MDLHQGDVLMDAYCGSGTIGLCAAKEAQNKGIGIMLLGVERNPAGIADARRNAELNGLTRSAWFMADDATGTRRIDGKHVDALVVVGGI